MFSLLLFFFIELCLQQRAKTAHTRSAVLFGSFRIFLINSSLFFHLALTGNIIGRCQTDATLVPINCFDFYLKLLLYLNSLSWVINPSAAAQFRNMNKAVNTFSKV